MKTIRRALGQEAREILGGSVLSFESYSRGYKDPAGRHVASNSVLPIGLKGPLESITLDAITLLL